MPALLAVFGCAAFVLLAVVALNRIQGIPIRNLTRDPSNILNYPVY